MGTAEVDLVDPAEAAELEAAEALAQVELVILLQQLRHKETTAVQVKTVRQARLVETAED